MSDAPEDWRLLEDRALRQHAARVLQDPDAHPEHVDAAKRCLVRPALNLTMPTSALMALAPHEQAELRDLCASVTALWTRVAARRAAATS